MFNKRIIIFFARMIDYAVVFGLITIVTTLFSVLPLINLILCLLAPLMWAPLGALCLKRWKTTPGRAIFGIPAPAIASFKAGMKEELLLNVPPTSTKPKKSAIIRMPRFVLGLALSIFCIGSIGGEVWYLSQIKHSVIADHPISGWVPFTASKEKFRVNFPNEPSSTLTHIKSHSLDYIEYTSSLGQGIVYSVGHTQFPRSWRIIGVKTLMKKAFEGILENQKDVTTVVSNAVTHDGYPALAFSYTQGDKMIEGRLVVVGNQLFRLIVDRPAELQELPPLDEYFQTFHYTK